MGTYDILGGYDTKFIHIGVNKYTLGAVLIENLKYIFLFN